MQSKQDLVYADVRRKLAEGMYAPGERLNVAGIARELRTSNIPVREALRRLEAEGWLEYVGNSGMRVVERDRQTWINLNAPFAVLSAYATAEAADSLREKGITEFHGLNDQMTEAVEAGDYALFTSINAEFHQRMFDRTPNPELRRMVTDQWQRMHVMPYPLYELIPQRALESLDEHARILELIRDGAPELDLEAYVRGHTLLTVAASPKRPAGTGRS